MDLLVIGDVHGCYHTFRKLLDSYWDPEKEMLIQLGDLIDRGKNTAQTLQFAWKLKKRHGRHVIFLKGNHELELLEHYINGPNRNWLRQCGHETLERLSKSNIHVSEAAEWINVLPLYWENEHVFISHAGISAAADDPLNEFDPNGILWNRSPLKPIGKLQIIGHTPCQTPEYDKTSHSWNIDTGAFARGGLSALKVTQAGEVLRIIHCQTDPDDL